MKVVVATVVYPVGSLKNAWSAKMKEQNEKKQARRFVSRSARWSGGLSKQKEEGKNDVLPQRGGEKPKKAPTIERLYLSNYFENTLLGFIVDSLPAKTQLIFITRYH